MPAHELQGYLLGQRRNTIESTLGKPFKVIKSEDGWVDVAFVEKKSENYLVFSFAKDGNEPTVAIQFTGPAVPTMRPFQGLRLGDSVAAVEARLGKPSSIGNSTEDGTRQYNYKGRAFSLEINSSGKLSSIRISDDDVGPDLDPPVEALFLAASTCNVESLLELVSGDLEVYRGGDAWGFEHSALTDLSNPSKMREAICGNSHSLHAAFAADEVRKNDSQLRVTEKGPSGPVIKFPDSKIVKEIFYKREAGAWRAFEVTLR